MALLFSHGAAAVPIPDDPEAPRLEAFMGEPLVPHPLGDKAVSQHPHLAPQSTLHVDLYNSGVTDLQTPLGRDPVVTSHQYGEVIGTCLNFTYDGDGNLFAFCGVLGGDTIDFQVTWLDATTFEKRSAHTLLSFTLAELAALPIDLGYMFLDARGRVIGIDRDNQVRFIGLGAGPDPELVEEERWDLSPIVDPLEDHVATVVPDYDGTYWFLTLGDRRDDGSVVPARVGIIDDAEIPAATVFEFEGEVVENGLAMGPEGPYVVSDRALYALRRDPLSGQIVVRFREPYERATRLKPGVISFGSGASPTLLGDRYVIITDNADDQIHLLVYDRRVDVAGDRLVCKVPLFEPGQSANENSVVAHGRSIIVQNWYGAPESIIGGDRKTTVPGLARIDVRADGSGCDEVWHNRAIATPATVKLSSATGAIYGVEVARDVPEVDAWYAFMVDFETGETRNRVLLGTGAKKDILFSPTYFGPDGTLLQPVAAGLVTLRDGVEVGADSLDGGETATGLDGGSGLAASATTVHGGCLCGLGRSSHGGAAWTVASLLAVAGMARRGRR